MAEKYTSGSWIPTSYRKYSTDTDNITSFPKTIIGDGTAVSAYTVKGDMEQSGTPTPSAPIYPSECGERTVNLFDFNRQRSDEFVLDTTKYMYGARADRPPLEPQFIERFEYDGDNFMVLSTHGAGIGFLAEVKPNTTYTVSFQCDVSVAVGRTSAVLNLITSNGDFGTFWGIYGDDRSFTFTTNTDTAYVYMVFRVVNSRATYSNIMLVESSTAPTSYIPYGYQIPLTLGNTTTPIYLGDVQSTRQIKKLVLTGQEDWLLHTSYANLFRLNTITDYLFALQNITICNAYKGITNGGAAYVGDKQIGFYYTSDASTRTLYIKDTNYSTAEDFKTYLAQQYANGTPVTVWYVLATPQTTTLNEPLRKINTYADSVSGSNLPTSGQAESFDVGTTLKPSEVSLTYHGWHEKRDKVYTNGSWVENV